MARGRPDWSPTAVDVVLRPDWAAVEGTDKSFAQIGSLAGFASESNIDYLVPAGKTLYITQLSFALVARFLADANANQMGFCYIKEATPGAPYSWLGGNGGGATNYPKPMVYTAGQTFRLGVISEANHQQDFYISAQGYEK